MALLVRSREQMSECGVEASAFASRNKAQKATITEKSDAGCFLGFTWEKDWNIIKRGAWWLIVLAFVRCVINWSQQFEANHEYYCQNVFYCCMTVLVHARTRTHTHTRARVCLNCWNLPAAAEWGVQESVPHTHTHTHTHIHTHTPVKN